MVDLDTVAFESFVSRGKALETAEDKKGAMAWYAKAVRLYQGDYFRDDPYLEAADRDREIYRRMCIDILERMAGIYGEQGLFQETIDAWHKILKIDSCQEGAYRHLMILYGQAGMNTEAFRSIQGAVRLWSGNWIRCRTAVPKRSTSG